MSYLIKKNADIFPWPLYRIVNYSHVSISILMKRTMSYSKPLCLLNEIHTVCEFHGTIPEVSQTMTHCIFVKKHYELTLLHQGVSAYLAVKERAKDRQRRNGVCVLLCACLVWGWIAARLTISYEQVSDSEKHQIREQVLTQPVVIDPGSTGHPKNH